MQKIGAVILAAGESSRFGRPKQLVQFRGKSLVRRVVDAAKDANCSVIVVVLGSKREQIERELKETDAIVAENQNWQRGIGSSIRVGVESAVNQAPDIEAIVLLTCDQPFVKTDTIERLIVMREKTKKAIVASSYSETLGVPALFDRSCFQELLTLPDDSGAKSIILSNHERVAELLFPEGKIDIDTAADYEKLIAQSIVSISGTSGT
jgi:molybdenum cofactor cytidylyltransferase